MVGRFLKKASLVLCISCLFSGFVCAEPSDNRLISSKIFLGDYVSRIWTVNDGVPGNTITDLIQSKSGYIYFGTYTGLCRFDGMEFVNLNRNYDPKYNFVSARAVFEDKKGRIWVGSNDEGLVRINTDGTVSSFTLENGIPNSSIRAINEDSTGVVWVGTAAGVACVATDDSVYRPVGLSDYDDENLIVRQLYCDTAGRMWIVSDKEGGTYVFSNDRIRRFQGFNTRKNVEITYVTQDSEGNFWYGLAPHYAICVRGVDEIFYDVGHEELRGTLVNSIYQDMKGNIWFSLDYGVTILHDGKLAYYDTSLGLADNNVNVILEDKEGNIWFGTDRAGLQKLSFGKFKTVSMNTSVNAIAEEKDKNYVWLGCDDGLYCYDTTTETFVENDFTRFCKNIRIRHVGFASDGSLLVSAYEVVGQLKMSDKGIISWTEENGLVGNKVRVCIETKDGKLYVGTTQGLSIISPDGNIVNMTIDQGLPNNYIMCLYEDSNGVIWGGTDGGGVFTLKGGKVDKCYTTSDGLSGNVIFKISEMNGPGEIWVSTGSGVTCIRDGKFVSASFINGLGTDAVFQMIPDYTGTVWYLSNRGIGAVKLTDLLKIMNGEANYITSKFYGNSDGIQSKGVTSTALSMEDSQGRIWFTMVDGFTIYNPLKIKNSTKPEVAIDSIMVGSEKVDPRAGKVFIAPEISRISIKFTGLSYISSDQMLFRYMLSGFDTDFSSWSHERTVSYTNLKPGTYIFKVQTENEDEVQSEFSDEIVIVKQPYIWQLWWFWMIIGLIVIGTVVLIILSRYRQMKRYQRKLEREVAAQTKELKEQTIELQRQAEALASSNALLEEANQKSEKLLLNILPRSIAQELTDKPNEIIAKQYPEVSVLFADLVGFTRLSSGFNAREIVRMLNRIFCRFDGVLNEYGVEKIKTIGDAYMVAAGLSETVDPTCAERMIRLAARMYQEMSDFNKSSAIELQMRIGINSGNLVAGVIGKTKFIYDIWGDTVNVASRMESTGKAGKIHVTDHVYEMTRDIFHYGEPEEIEVKGKGLMKTYFLDLGEILGVR
ncbi:MAG: adenylate/guanylate cyclase domain-containing protein [Treponema sp.]|nr:adenylate/guanylate cyclase domain-containing protein [Treponema sp.]